MAMTPQEKRKERFVALATALVLLLTAIGAVLSFAQAAEAFQPEMRKGVNVTILVIVVLNTVLSVYVFIHGKKLVSSLAPEKAYLYGGGASLSATWDVVAMALAIFALASPAIYLYLGIVLTIDVVIDNLVDFKR